LAQINAEKIFPVFEKRFPGIKINHVDATSDKLAARAITEARGGKTLADVVEFGLQDLNKIHEQGLILEKVPPEGAAYPANLKGSYWVANNLIFIVGAWNTEKVKKQEEPKSLDDFGDPRWQGRLIAEPRDYEPVVGLMHKHKSLDKAREVLTKIAANNVEFHQGHSQLAELLVAGQAAACFTCYSHHYPVRVKKGAPVDYMRSEGIAATPHSNQRGSSRPRPCQRKDKGHARMPGRPGPFARSVEDLNQVQSMKDLEGNIQASMNDTTAGFKVHRPSCKRLREDAAIIESSQTEVEVKAYTYDRWMGGGDPLQEGIELGCTSPRVAKAHLRVCGRGVTTVWTAGPTQIGNLRGDRPARVLR
jgi:hypothetical protein